MIGRQLACAPVLYIRQDAPYYFPWEQQLMIMIIYRRFNQAIVDWKLDSHFPWPLLNPAVLLEALHGPHGGIIKCRPGWTHHFNSQTSIKKTHKRENGESSFEQISSLPHNSTLHFWDRRMRFALLRLHHPFFKNRDFRAALENGNCFRRSTKPAAAFNPWSRTLVWRNGSLYSLRHFQLHIS